jgi:GT2 family glycosyltransferase
MLAFHGDGIVSGFYTIKAPPFSPVALRGGVRHPGSKVTQYWHDLEALNDHAGLRPQEVVGMGCTLIPVSVFAAMGGRPWFAYADDDDGFPRVSEDVPFCERARAAGCPVSLAPGVRCGHIATILYDHQWAERHYLHLADAALRAQVATTPARAAQDARIGDEVV